MIVGLSRSRLPTICIVSEEGPGRACIFPKMSSAWTRTDSMITKPEIWCTTCPVGKETDRARARFSTECAELNQNLATLLSLHIECLQESLRRPVVWKQAHVGRFQQTVQFVSKKLWRRRLGPTIITMSETCKKH